jgi:hypothetical protein
MLVEVRPRPIQKWHGKKNRESFSMPKVVEALYDEHTGKLATGLTELEAKQYSQLLGGVDLSDTFNVEAPHPFWGSKPGMVKLENSTMVFNTNKPLDAVRVKLMKASKYVANSQKELDEGKWGEATHVIFDEEENVELKASKIAQSDECVLLKSKLSLDDKASLVQIIAGKAVRGRSANFIEVELKDIIDNKPEEFLKYIKMGKEEVYVRATVYEAIHKNVLTREGTGVYYMGDVLGIDVEDTITWFKNPQNQKLKVAIMERLTQIKK